ncbi:MAG: hypothetical protein ABSE82_02875 [Nitrososphaerales archaeon]|jgi:hypothetical protein
MSSLTIWIEHKNSYALATELVLSLQETKALVDPVSAPQTNNSITTLDIPDLQHDARERIISETSNWASTKGLESIPTEKSDVFNLTIR